MWLVRGVDGEFVAREGFAGVLELEVVLAEEVVLQGGCVYCETVFFFTIFFYSFHLNRLNITPFIDYN